MRYITAVSTKEIPGLQHVMRGQDGTVACIKHGPIAESPITLWHNQITHAIMVCGPCLLERAPRLYMERADIDPQRIE